MTDNVNQLIIPEETVMSKILFIRGTRVIIDSDIADMFGVQTKRLNEQVKRNIKRFPVHFMFQLSEEEKDKVVANCDHLKKLKYSPFLPFAFTEHGVIMLANVLNSERAIQASVRIVEVFIKMREMLMAHKELFMELEQIRQQLTEHDNKLLLIFEYLKQFEEAKQQQLEQENRKRIGFTKEEK